MRNHTANYRHVDRCVPEHSYRHSTQDQTSYYRPQIIEQPPIKRPWATHPGNNQIHIGINDQSLGLRLLKETAYLNPQLAGIDRNPRFGTVLKVSRNVPRVLTVRMIGRI